MPTATTRVESVAREHHDARVRRAAAEEAGRRHELRARTNDVVDGDEDELDEEADEAHDRKADRRRLRNLRELCGRRQTNKQAQRETSASLTPARDERCAARFREGVRRTCAVGLRAALHQPPRVTDELPYRQASTQAADAMSVRFATSRCGRSDELPLCSGWMSTL